MTKTSESKVAKSIGTIQNRLHSEIFKSNDLLARPNVDTSFFVALQNYGHDICALAYGTLGSRLYELSYKLDWEHVEIGDFFYKLTEGKADKDQIIEYLDLVALAKKNNLVLLDGIFQKAAKYIFHDVKASLNFVKNFHQYVRWYKDPVERAEARKLKEICPFNIQSTKLGGIWDSVNDLECYGRFGNFQAEQINKTKKRIDVYKQYRLSTMCAEIESSLKSIEACEDYYGFQRISIITTAILLAKMHNFNLVNNEITVPAETIDFDFEQGAKAYVSPDGKVQKRSIIDYEYGPNAYPLHEFNDKQLEGVKDIVDYLEHFPAANYKPIFDHFIVVVPGLKAPRNGLWQLFDPYCNKKIFNDYYSAKKYLDMMLIDEKCIFPALLGEKDGYAYFICFLN